MKQVRLLLLTGLLLFAQFLYAQNRTINGKVTDANGTSIPGATISVTGTKLSTVAGATGNFSIGVPPGNRSVTITSVGYTTQTVDISQITTVNVSLAESLTEMTAVVVTGYGNVER